MFRGCREIKQKKEKAGATLSFLLLSLESVVPIGCCSSYKKLYLLSRQFIRGNIVPPYVYFASLVQRPGTKTITGKHR